MSSALDGSRPRAAEPEAALFNEAYLGMLIAIAVRNYEQRSGRPMPWMLPFLVIPLVIHRSTRERLPGSTRAHFSNWIAGNPLVYAEFGVRAAAFAPYVRRAMRYAIRGRVISIENGGLRSRVSATRHTALRSAEARETGNKAGLVGRWFALVEDVPSIFRQLGVMP